MLVLPGQNADNWNWAKDLSARLGKATGHDCPVFEYPWWKDPTIRIDPEGIARSLTAMNHSVIVAKSVGTLICSLAIHRGFIQPEKVVLIGIPLNTVGAEEISWLQEIPRLGVKVLVIQQSNDKVGKYADIVARLPGSGVDFIEVVGEDHRYRDTGSISKLCIDWLP